MGGAMRMSDQSPVAGERVADALHLDGNVAAGMLSEMFVPDLTAARTTCAHCGATRMMGALLAYAHGMGIVVRCPNCRSEEHTSELQSHVNLVCRPLLEKK